MRYIALIHLLFFGTPVVSVADPSAMSRKILKYIDAANERILLYEFEENPAWKQFFYLDPDDQFFFAEKSESELKLMTSKRLLEDILRATKNEFNSLIEKLEQTDRVVSPDQIQILSHRISSLLQNPIASLSAHEREILMLNFIELFLATNGPIPVRLSTPLRVLNHQTSAFSDQFKTQHPALGLMFNIFGIGSFVGILHAGAHGFLSGNSFTQMESGASLLSLIIFVGLVPVVGNPNLWDRFWDTIYLWTWSNPLLKRSIHDIASQSLAAPKNKAAQVRWFFQSFEDLYRLRVMEIHHDIFCRNLLSSETYAPAQ